MNQNQLLFLQSLKSNLLSLNLRNTLNSLQLLHKLTLQRFIISLGPCPMLFQWLDNTNFEVETSPAYLTSYLGTREVLEFG